MCRKRDIVKIIVYRSDRVISFFLVMYFCGRAGAAGPITIQLKAQRKKLYSLCLPSSPSASPSLSLPTKSPNDSHASDTPPTPFLLPPPKRSEGDTQACGVGVYWPAARVRLFRCVFAHLVKLFFRGKSSY